MSWINTQFSYLTNSHIFCLFFLGEASIEKNYLATLFKICNCSFLVFNYSFFFLHSILFLFCFSSLSFLSILIIVSLTFDSVLFCTISFPPWAQFFCLFICFNFCISYYSNATWSFSAHLFIQVRHQKDDQKSDV